LLYRISFITLCVIAVLLGVLIFQQVFGNYYDILLPVTPDGSLPIEYQSMLDPLEILTYVANKIALGICVTDMLFHNPVVLARRFAILDILSEGRAICGNSRRKSNIIVIIPVFLSNRICFIALLNSVLIERNGKIIRSHLAQSLMARQNWT